MINKKLIMRADFFLVGLGLFTILLFYLGFDLSKYEFMYNDGPSYFCSFFGRELFHFGSKDIIACTYDHQPFYFILLKWIRFLTRSDINLMRWLHQLIWVACGVYIYEIAINRGHNKFISVLVALAVLTSPAILIMSLQFRMYTLYLLFALILIHRRETLRWDALTTRILAFLAYLNFIFVLLPLAQWHFSDLMKSKWRSFKKIIQQNSILILLASVKVVYVAYHRVGRRPWPGYSFYETYDFYRHFQEMYNVILGWPYTNMLTLNLILVTIYTTVVLGMVLFVYLYGDVKNRSVIHFCVISYAVIFVLRFVFIIEEIEYRYILYVTPLLFITSIELVKNQRPRYQYAICIFLLLIITTNFSYGKKFIDLNPITKNEILKLHELIKKEKPRFMYSFFEYRDVNYIMSYLHMFWGENVPILEFKHSIGYELLAGINYFIVETSSKSHEPVLFREIINNTKSKAELLACLDLNYPRVCIYKIFGDQNFKNLSDDKIKQYLIPFKSLK